MKWAPLMTVLGALGAGAVGGYLASVEEAPPTREADPLVEEALDRLARIEDDLARLDERLALLETAPLARLEPVEAPRPEPERSAAPSEPEAAHEGSTTTLPVPEEVLEEKVAQTLAEIRSREEEERRKEREERRQRMLENWLQRISEELGLMPYQTAKLREVLTAQSARMEALRDEIRESGDWGRMRDEMRKLRDESQQQLAGFLTQEQIEKLGEQMPRGLFGFGRPRRGFGGPPGGG